MEEHVLAPQQILKKYIQSGVGKVKNPLWKTFLFGALAGAFVGLGACCSTVAMHGIDDVGISRTLGGVIFPIGLILIILIGGELFTGNCLLIMGVIEKKFSAWEMLKNLFVVYMGNLAGSAVVAFLVVNSGQFGYSQDALGAFVIRTAVTKIGLPFGTALASGILCNILVCGAVLLALAAKDAVGKVLCVFFPIFVFVIAGFEHCVANMYYIIAGIMAAANPVYAGKAAELYGYSGAMLENLSLGNMFINNLLPVTIGNFIGGAFFLALPLYFLNRGKKETVEGKLHRIV